jgi:hypothetical protein
VTILPFDEINALEDRLKVHFDDEGKIKSRQDCEDILDEMLDLLLLSYANGVRSVSDTYTPTVNDIEETVYEKIKGRTWVERVWDYYDNGGTLNNIVEIARTEAHRDANAAAYHAARETGKTRKVWHCMMLDTSRDDHIWLDGVTAPIDGYFYAGNGDRTQYPGQWGVPEQDCNCLCFCTYE